MKQWKMVLVAVIVIALARLEHTGERIERLEPVQTLVVVRENGQIRLKTDTGAQGVGDALESAVGNLHTSASGRIFLDTVQYLAVGTTETELLEDLSRLLRPTVQVCCIRGQVDPEEIGKYLSVHPPGVKLADTMKTELPVLYYQNGRGQLVFENNP